MTLYVKLLIAALVLFFAGVVTGAWLASKPTAPAGEYSAPKKDDRIADVGTEPVKPKDCTVIASKPAAKDKLGLPDQVKRDPKQHVTSAVIIRPDERPQSVVSLFDEATGKTSSLTQRMAYPLLATEQRGQLWLGYGIRNGGERVGRILLREDLLQVMALHGGVQASIDTDGRYFAGAGVVYRW
jgi:hypothetical protein